VIQTDTAINKGNSGGPLFDHLGRLVGINFAIVSDTGLNQGIGFAIPSNTVKEVFRQLKEKGEVERGFLGAVLQDLDINEAKGLGLQRAGAVLVRTTEVDKPAWSAGLRAGDIIVKYNGEALGASNPRRQLWQLIMDTKVGTQIPLVVVRDDTWSTKTVTIGKRPPETTCPMWPMSGPIPRRWCAPGSGKRWCVKCSRASRRAIANCYVPHSLRNCRARRSAAGSMWTAIICGCCYFAQGMNSANICCVRRGPPGHDFRRAGLVPYLPALRTWTRNLDTH